METYNNNQACEARVVTVTFERSGNAGTGVASRVFGLNGRVTVTGGSLFPSTVARRLRNLGGMTTGSKATEAPKADCSLTETTFAQIFSQTVGARPELSIIDNVLSVNELTEEVDCNLGAEFTSKVIVTFAGDPSLESIPQLESLAKSFGVTYKSASKLNLETCDPFFREVSSVSIITPANTVDSINRQLEAPHRSLAGTLSYLYTVNSQCRGCPASTRLFGEASGRRELFTERKLQTNTCTCSADATEYRASTTDEFAAEYGVPIVVLHEEAVIDPNFIESVLWG